MSDFFSLTKTKLNRYTHKIYNCNQTNSELYVLLNEKRVIDNN